ncbi:MAG: OmpA family protein [Prolixibacteraceae bacterium]|nr:OmpA family protein [Prolixibacteraceae bacterium]
MKKISTKYITFLFSVFMVLQSSGQNEPAKQSRYDDFSRDNEEWHTETNKKCRTTIQTGTLVIENGRKAESFVYKQYDSINWRDDFTIESTFRLKNFKGKNIIWGIGVADNAENKSVYALSSSKQTAIITSPNLADGFTDGVEVPEIDFKSDIQLKIIHSGNKLDILINGNLVKSSYYRKPFGNKIGFWLAGESEMHVDYIKLDFHQREINLVKNPDNGYKKENLGKSINTEFNEFAPLISTDGKRLYFVRNNNPSIVDKWGNENQEIYYSTLEKDSTWSLAKDIGKPLNNTESNFVVAITPDQNALFLGNRYAPDGKPAGGGLSKSTRLEENTWSIPENVSIEGLVNTSNYVSYAFSPDQNVLITALENDESMGNLDLFVSFLSDDGTWSRPINMGEKINSYDLEFSPFVAADAKTLYFSSTGHPGYGSADVFVSERLDDTWQNWSEPKNLGPEINTKDFDGYFTIPASGDVAYLSSSENSVGGSDIFRIILSEDARPEPVALVSGKVVDVNSGDPLKAEILYKLLETDKLVGTATSNETDGRYQISLKGGHKYSYMAQKDGYYSISENINLTALTTYLEIKKNLTLAPIKTGQVIRLNNLFFIFDTAKLIEESQGELKQLLSTLENNPNLKIEIAGHTDSKGSDAYNIDLSDRRAQAVVDYLVENGIDSQRLQWRGYGESKPIASNDTDEGRQQNRRVEFEVLEE